jgi:hypothetical protein
LQGFLRKAVCSVWFFGGEVVVNCVVNVVLRHHVFRERKNCNVLDYFFNQPVLGNRGLSRSQSHAGLFLKSEEDRLAQRLHQLVDGSVEIFVGAALLVDLCDRVHDRGVVLAAELTADLR